MSPLAEQGPAYRERCYTCFRPVSRCFCDQIPQVDNQTGILILQHVKERFHAFNTARIVKAALRNAQLIVDQTPTLAAMRLPLHSSTGVLYPGEGARLLSEVTAAERPQQLVILDGTWHHAQTFMKQIPVLRTLPRYCLQPQSPSTYRIRREPTETALSTLEATVAALRHLEPQTEGLDQLVRAFDTMIDNQLQHPRQSARIRKRTANRAWRPPANVPRSLSSESQRLIVVYGEAALSQPADGVRHPVYWVAERLATGEVFECPVQHDSLTDELLQHMELTRDDFQDASLDIFRRAWNDFVDTDDVIVAYNSSTLRLLEAAGIPPQRQVSLKSVNLGVAARTLDDVLETLGVQPDAARCRGRSGRRLANAAALTRYLQSLSTPSGPPEIA